MKINKILFVGPRFHTNYNSQIKTLIKKGFKVKFLAKTKGKIENYEYLKPIILDESLFSLFRKKFFGNIGSNNVQYFPKLNQLFNFFKNFKPEITIIRLHGRLFTYLIAIVAKLYGSKILFYDQVNLLNFKNNLFNKIELNLRNFFFSSKLASPIIENKIKDIYYLPFCSSTVKKKKNNDKYLKILSIGKFVERKRHLFLIKTIKKYFKNTKIKIDIVGEVSNKKHAKIKNEINNFLIKNNLSQKVNIYKNINNKKIRKFYHKNDLFILPSKDEPASFSIIEALGFGLPVICSDSCGTQNYIKKGINGLVFKTDDPISLKNKIKIFLRKKNLKKYKNNVINLNQNLLSEENYYNFFKKLVI